MCYYNCFLGSIARLLDAEIEEIDAAQVYLNQSVTFLVCLIIGSNMK